MRLSHEQVIPEKKLYVLSSGRAELDGLNDKEVILGVMITKHLKTDRARRISVSNHPSTLLLSHLGSLGRRLGIC